MVRLYLQGQARAQVVKPTPHPTSTRTPQRTTTRSNLDLPLCSYPPCSSSTTPWSRLSYSPNSKPSLPRSTLNLSPQGGHSSLGRHSPRYAPCPPSDLLSPLILCSNCSFLSPSFSPLLRLTLLWPPSFFGSTHFKLYAMFSRPLPSRRLASTGWPFSRTILLSNV